MILYTSMYQYINIALRIMEGSSDADVLQSSLTSFLRGAFWILLIIDANFNVAYVSL